MTELYNNNLKVFPTSLFLNEIRRRILVTEIPKDLWKADLFEQMNSAVMEDARKRTV